MLLQTSLIRCLRSPTLSITPLFCQPVHFSLPLPLQWGQTGVFVSTWYARVFWCGFSWTVIEKGTCLWFPWWSVSRWHSLLHPWSKVLASLYALLYIMHIFLLARQNQYLLFQEAPTPYSEQLVHFPEEVLPRQLWIFNTVFKDTGLPWPFWRLLYTVSHVTTSRLYHICPNEKVHQRHLELCLTIA